MKLKIKNQESSKLKEKILYYILIFLIGSLIGWIYEEIFYYFTEHTISNRGFLYGPYLPVYGWGSLLLATSLKKIKKYPIFVFIGAMLITGILEYFTGLGMDMIWHKKWWDYTGLFMNIQGYVCLRSIITFAIGAIFLIYIINPFFDKIIKKNKKLITIISIIFLIIFVIDNIITFSIRY